MADDACMLFACDPLRSCLISEDSSISECSARRCSSLVTIDASWKGRDSKPRPQHYECCCYLNNQ